jgi:glycosyltransferase involved in cell wall biosynthesis
VFLFISFQSLTSTGAGGTGKIAYEVARNLFEKKHPVKLIVSSKGKFSTAFLSLPVSFWSRYYLFLLNKFIAPLLKPYQKRHLEERLFDLFCSRHIKRGQKIVFTTTPFIPRTLKKAKHLGIPIVFFPGTPEENHIAELVIREATYWNISSQDVYTYATRLKVFNSGVDLMDYIFCHSSIIEQTFRKNWSAKKFISCPGLLKPSSSNNESTAQSNTFTVLYAAHTVWLKGLQYLLKAWKELSIDGTLVIVGSVDPGVQELIDREFNALKNVTFTGPVVGIDAYAKEASVLVCPSLIDGGPVTVMEAMRFGVPSIVTQECGVKDFIRSGETGWIVEAGNASELVTRIRWCYDNSEACKRVGAAAQRMLLEYDFNAFIENIASETLALRNV